MATRPSQNNASPIGLPGTCSAPIASAPAAASAALPDAVPAALALEEAYPLPSSVVAPVVALDIGQVCVHLELDRLAQAFGFDSFAAGAAADPSLMPWSLAFERGEMGEAEFLAHLAERVPAGLTLDAVETAWNAILGDEIAGMATQVQRMRDLGLRIVYLSDICPVHHRAIERQLSFHHLVADAVVSYRVGTLKPHPAMYAAMEREHCGGGVPALYLDDKLGNIDGARARGWRAYQVGTVAGIAAELDRLAAAPTWATP